VDTQALTDFANGGDVYVVTWYDQSGNNRNASQGTQASQPQIVAGGSVVTVDGETSMQFDGNDDVLITPTSVDAGQEKFTVFAWSEISAFSGFTSVSVGVEPVGTFGDPGWYIADESTNGEILAVKGSGSTLRNTKFVSPGNIGMALLELNGDTDEARFVTFDKSSQLQDVSKTEVKNRIPTSGRPLRIGSAGSFFLDGHIETIVLYPSLRADDAAKFHNATQY
jgi:hypothetical protein